MRPIALSLPLWLLVACGDSVGPPAPDTGQAALPCDLDELLAQRCRDCHGAEPKFGAPMPLLTRADMLAAPIDGVGTIAERALSRMAGEAGSRMPPPPHEAATAAEMATLQAWIDAGHPTRESGKSCGGNGGAGAGGGGQVGCEPNLALAAQAPFEMPATSTDEQVCFGIDVPASEVKRHITAILPKIDNDSIIHHILLLQSPTAVSPEPVSCNFTSSEWKLLYAWGPGTPPHELPEEAGFPMDAGEPAHFVMQIHYNNLNGLEGETDQSGIDLCTTSDLRAHDADVMAFGGLFGDDIAPMATSEATCTTPIPEELASHLPVTLYQSWPHMHTVGKELHGWIERGGETIPLVDVDDYDFEYQLTYPTHAQLQVGDVVHTRCVWTNNTTEPKSFGEDTNDEMCFNFVTYYPRIEGGFWSWLLPAATASCDMSVQ